MRRRLVSVAIACLSFFSGAACAQLAPIRIGLIAPLTGNTSDAGNSMRYGAELAVREINEVGGLAGRPLELVMRDDKSLPEAGRQAAEELVLREKVDFTLGFCNTGVAMRALDVFQRNQHVLIVPCSQGTAVTSTYPAAESYIFRVGAADRSNAEFLVGEIERAGHRQVAILADDTGYGEGGVKDITAELARRQLAPVYVTRFPVDATSVDAQMRAAKEAGADAIVVYTIGSGQAAAVRSRMKLGWKVPYYAPWPLSFRSTLELAGPQALEGTMMAQTIIQDTANERRTSFIARYARHSGERPIGSLMAAAQAYDAVHLALRALFRTKGVTSGPALKAALESIDKPYQGVVTTYHRPFTNDDHEAFATNMIWLGVWRKGEIVFAHEEDAKRSSYIRRKAPSAQL